MYFFSTAPFRHPRARPVGLGIAGSSPAMTLTSLPDRASVSPLHYPALLTSAGARQAATVPPAGREFAGRIRDGPESTRSRRCRGQSRARPPVHHPPENWGDPTTYRDTADPPPATTHARCGAKHRLDR